MASKEDFAKLLLTQGREAKAEYRQELVIAVQQSRPELGDVEQAILQSDMEASLTPWVMLRKDRGVSTLLRVAGLREDQEESGVLSLVWLLAIADSRRRRSSTDCDAGVCNHWWHGDLSSEVAIAKILGPKALP